MHLIVHSILEYIYSERCTHLTGSEMKLLITQLSQLDD